MPIIYKKESIEQWFVLGKDRLKPTDKYGENLTKHFKTQSLLSL